MGAAACDHLARRGQRVLGIEQFELGHDRGSSHGQTRVIRKAYFEDSRYVPLLHDAYRLWRELEIVSGKPLMRMAGCVNIGPADHPAIVGVLKSANDHHLPHEVLTAEVIRSRWPAFNCEERDIGVYEAEAGFLRPERCIGAMAESARCNGAVLHMNECVVRWEATDECVRVETDRDRYDASKLVVTAGPWLSSVCSDLGLPLRVERQVQTWFTPTCAPDFGVGRLPSFIHFTGERAYYGIPIDADAPPPFNHAVKIARHHGGEIITPDTVQREVTSADEADVRGYIRRFMPGADGPLAAAKVCLYTNTPDDYFIIDRHPQHAHVFLAGGFSGHGFKFAPVVGEVLADLVTTGTTRHPIDLFSIARFGN